MLTMAAQNGLTSENHLRSEAITSSNYHSINMDGSLTSRASPTNGTRYSQPTSTTTTTTSTTTTPGAPQSSQQAVPYSLEVPAVPSNPLMQSNPSMSSNPADAI